MNLIKTIFLFLIMWFFYSCEKVIDIELKNSDVKFVVEGIITNEPGSCRVYLTRTKPFNEDNNFPKVSGATVKVKDNNVEYTLTESAPGVYETVAITGAAGHEYQLTVAINNEAFTAFCSMPQPAVIDTLYISPGPFGQFKFATIAFRDPAGVKNGYRFVQYVNGVKDPMIFWGNDEFIDGRLEVIQLDTGVDKKDDPRNIKSGDEVTIEMHSLDEAIYKYWYSLRSGGGDGSANTAAPANPLTNIKGGALGYFSAHTVSRKTVIAP